VFKVLTSEKWYNTYASISDPRHTKALQFLRTAHYSSAQTLCEPYELNKTQ